MDNGYGHDMADENGRDVANEIVSRKVVVAVDDSHESMHALTWMLDNLLLPCPAPAAAAQKKFEDSIVLLHVQPKAPANSAAPAHGFCMTTEMRETLCQHQTEISQKVTQRGVAICQEKNIPTETRIVYGDPREAICDAVDKIQPSFLVIGSHGYGAIKRAFLGSVSDYCAHHAKCPVVIVKNSS